MAKSSKTVLAAASAAALAAALLLLFFRSSSRQEEPETAAGSNAARIRQGVPKAAPRRAAAARPERRAAADSGVEEEGKDDAAEPEKEEPQSAADAFDAVVDRWMEPSEKGVSMEDVDAFAAAFRAVPAEQRDDCMRRALNLIPDENALLLAGVLMDKSQDKEVVEAVFNDVLNRSEEVKKPILRQIFKDKSHPCWADTAWILDVTGEATEK